jgi:DNA modification methylase
LGEIPTKKPKSILYKPEYSSNSGTTLLREIIGERKFNNPKPLVLMEDIIYLLGSKNAVILDIFAGSGTTGHAILNLNNKDGGNRTFILCELDKNICNDICYERLKKVINGYNKTTNEKTIKPLGGNLRYMIISFEKYNETIFNIQHISKEFEDILKLKEGSPTRSGKTQ